MKRANGHPVLPPPTIVDEHGVEVYRLDSDLRPTPPTTRHTQPLCPAKLRPHDPRARCWCRRA